jgi:pyrroloquinoline-quinone synthase
MCEFCEHSMDDVVAAGHPSTSEWFWAELRAIQQRWDVLRHPFYTRWSAGELRRHELKTYAEEYDHLVIALAVASRHAAQKADGLLGEALGQHAEEEVAHVNLWRAFAKGTGWGPADVGRYGAEPYPDTVVCARVWGGDLRRSLALDLVTLYAIEGPQPRIAQTKLDGLLGHYGFTEGPATQYFSMHAELDKEHAALAQSALGGMLEEEDPFELLAQAGRVHCSYWHMLDGLEAAGGE